MHHFQRQQAIWDVRLMNRVFPQPEFSNWPVCEHYISQARHCAELITHFEITQNEAASLLLRLGTYCCLRAFYQEAEQYLRRALRLYEQAKKPDQPTVAQASHILALVYYRLGNYSEAETLYQCALRIREHSPSAAKCSEWPIRKRP